MIGCFVNAAFRTCDTLACILSYLLMFQYFYIMISEQFHFIFEVVLLLALCFMSQIFLYTLFSFCDFTLYLVFVTDRSSEMVAAASVSCLRCSLLFVLANYNISVIYSFLVTLSTAFPQVADCCSFVSYVSPPCQWYTQESVCKRSMEKPKADFTVQPDTIISAQIKTKYDFHVSRVVCHSVLE